MHWPAPTFRNFVAAALLCILAARPHAHAHESDPTRTRYASSSASSAFSPNSTMSPSWKSTP